MRVIVSPRASRRLREIQSRIAYDNVTAALRVVNRIRQCTDLLVDHPRLGRDWDGHTLLDDLGLVYRHGQVMSASSKDREALFLKTWDIVDAYLASLNKCKS